MNSSKKGLKMVSILFLFFNYFLNYFPGRIQKCLFTPIICWTSGSFMALSLVFSGSPPPVLYWRTAQSLYPKQTIVQSWRLCEYLFFNSNHLRKNRKLWTSTLNRQFNFLLQYIPLKII